MSEGRLVEEHSGQAFLLGPGPVTIGRDSDNTIILADAQVSRHHAEIAMQDGRWVIRDLESANGTFVNGLQIAGPQALDSGNAIQVGQTVFRVELPPSIADQDTLVMAQVSLGQAPPAEPPQRTGVSWLFVGMAIGALAAIALILFIALVVLPGNRQDGNVAAATPSPSATLPEPTEGVPVEGDATATGQPMGPSATPTLLGPTTTAISTIGPPSLVPTRIPPTATPRPPTRTPAPRPVIRYFSADQTELERGQCARLEWRGVENANSVTLTDVGQVGTSGKLDVCPDGPKTYLLEASGIGGTVQKSVQITIRTPVGPIIEYFRVVPSIISPGDCAQLEWGKVENAISATIDQGIGGVATPGSMEVCPGKTTTYVLTARDETGAFTAEATLFLSGKASQEPVIAFFTANPSRIGVGECTMLSWGKVDYATEVTINLGIGGVATPGSKEVCLGATTTYVMTAVGQGGTTVNSLTVTVSPGNLARLPDLVIESILFEPNPCYRGQSCNVRIKVRNDGPVGAGSFTLRWAPAGEEAVPVEWDLDSLSAGKERELKYGWLPERADSAWLTLATVDAYDEVEEIEEGTANTLEQVITVLEPRAP